MRKYIINPFTGLLDCIGIDNPTPPTSEYIVFADPEVERICIENWSSDGIGLTYEDAEAVTDLNGVFIYNGNTPPIITFEEFRFFTGLIRIEEFIDDYGQFDGADQLQSIILPPNLEKIGNFCFNACQSLNSIIIPNSVNYIGEGAFQDCQSLTSIITPNSVNYIGTSAFCNCIGLTTIEITNSITSIEYAVFQNCQSLISVVIPDSITTIGQSSFESCTALTSIIIPDSITTIGVAAFSNTGLISITCRNLIPPILQSSTFSNCINIANISVPAESVDAYKSAEGWSTYADLITAIVE